MIINRTENTYSIAPRLANGEMRRTGFSEILIESVELDSDNSNGTLIQVRYTFGSGKYLKDLQGKSRVLQFHMGVLDNSHFVESGEIRLKPSSSKKVDDDYGYHLQVLNLILQAFAAPMAFAGKLTFDLFDPTIESLISALNISSVNSKDSELVELMLENFAYTANLERNNMRYAMGVNSKGYAPPLQNVQSGISGIFGDFSQELETSIAYSDSVLMGDKKPMDITPSFDWKAYWKGQSQSDLISKDTDTVINMSFGKESLYAYEFLRKHGKTPNISVFQHLSLDSKGNLSAQGTYQSTYLEKVFKDLDYDVEPTVFIVQSNFLDSLLEPLCDVRLGAPICMLTHVFIQAQQINIGQSDLDVKYVLSGDEYERSIPGQIELTEGIKTEIHTYDWEQSPEFAARASKVADLFGKNMPRFGSVMYNITGYQAQMTLDLAYGYERLQTSCHGTHAHNGGNCGKCQKCIRIATVKKSIGNPSTLDYSIDDQTFKKCLNWTSSDFFVTSMPADQDVFLQCVHLNILKSAQFNANHYMLLEDSKMLANDRPPLPHMHALVLTAQDVMGISDPDKYPVLLTDSMESNKKRDMGSAYAKTSYGETYRNVF